MTVSELVSASGFDVQCAPCPEKEISGVYIGDLLSWVMGKASQGDLWLTIMSNVNVVAVASLADVSAIVLTEGVVLGSDVISVANSKGINVITTNLSTYEAALKISGIIQ
ncbi:MAG: hypothetical protein IJX92_05940 [Clostridia bacterium]|nr:hypothetical protein [Clostridia bacterium]